MLKIGNYIPATSNKPATIERKRFERGFVVIDEDAFLNHPDKVCYVPELSDCIYTRSSLLALCHNNLEKANKCFYGVDGQQPEAWLEEQIACEEWLQQPSEDALPPIPAAKMVGATC